MLAGFFFSSDKIAIDLQLMCFKWFNFSIFIPPRATRFFDILLQKILNFIMPKWGALSS